MLIRVLSVTLWCFQITNSTGALHVPRADCYDKMQSLLAGTVLEAVKLCNSLTTGYNCPTTWLDSAVYSQLYVAHQGVSQVASRYFSCVYLPLQFGLGPEQVGLAFLSGPLAYMLLSLVAGQLADKFVSLHIIKYIQFLLPHGKLLIFSLRVQDGL